MRVISPTKSRQTYPCLTDHSTTLDFLSLGPETRHLSSDGDKLKLLLEIKTFANLHVHVHRQGREGGREEGKEGGRKGERERDDTY